MEERWREPAALAEQYAGMLYRLAYARTGSRADAEDVMQEVSATRSTFVALVFK